MNGELTQEEVDALLAGKKSTEYINELPKEQPKALGKEFQNQLYDLLPSLLKIHFEDTVLSYEEYQSDLKKAQSKSIRHYVKKKGKLFLADKFLADVQIIEENKILKLELLQEPEVINKENVKDLEVELSIVVPGTLENSLEEILNFKYHSVIKLEANSGEPLDLLFNGVLLAKGEIIVKKENYAIRLIDILNKDFANLKSSPPQMSTGTTVTGKVVLFNKKILFQELLNIKEGSIFTPDVPAGSCAKLIYENGMNFQTDIIVREDNFAIRFIDEEDTSFIFQSTVTGIRRLTSYANQLLKRFKFDPIGTAKYNEIAAANPSGFIELIQNIEQYLINKDLLNNEFPLTGLYFSLLKTDVAAQIFKQFSTNQLESFSKKLSEAGLLTYEDMQTALILFSYFATTNWGKLKGKRKVKNILIKAFGSEKADTLYNQLFSQNNSNTFSFLNNIDSFELSTVLASEHPQTISLLLSYLPEQKSAEILMSLPQNIQTLVSKGISVMDKTLKKYNSITANSLQRSLLLSSPDNVSFIGGIAYFMDILSKTDKDTEKQILNALQEEHPELAKYILGRMNS